jgi:hypothetical protein
MDSKRTSTTLLTTLLRVPGGSALIAGYTGLVRGLGLLRRALVPTEVALLEMIMGSYRSQALAAACRLGVLEHIAGGPRLAAELARKMGADPGHLGRLLEFLTASGIVRRGRGEAYGLTRFGRGLLDGRAGSLKAFAEFNGAAPTWQAWAALDASVISGRSAFHIAHGEEFFPFAQRHSAFAAVFDRAMVGFSEALGPLLAAAYRFGPGTVVDVGGGRGALLAGVLQHQPDLAGVLYDLPEVIAAAPAYLAQPASLAASRWSAAVSLTACRPGTTTTCSRTCSMTGATASAASSSGTSPTRSSRAAACSSWKCCEGRAHSRCPRRWTLG